MLLGEVLRNEEAEANWVCFFASKTAKGKEEWTHGPGTAAK